MARVLLVEDDRTMSDLVSKYLDLLGYEWVVATNGKEGLQVAARESIDIVLSDVMMPEMDGLEFIKQFKKRNEFVPVIMISAHAQRDTLLTCLKEGAFDFIDKKKIVEELESTLSKAVQRRKKLLSYKQIEQNIAALHHIVLQLVASIANPDKKQVRLLEKIEKVLNEL